MAENSQISQSPELVIFFSQSRLVVKFVGTPLLFNINLTL